MRAGPLDLTLVGAGPAGRGWADLVAGSRIGHDRAEDLQRHPSDRRGLAPDDLTVSPPGRRFGSARSRSPGSATCRP